MRTPTSASLIRLLVVLLLAPAMGWAQSATPPQPPSPPQPPKAPAAAPRPPVHQAAPNATPVVRPQGPAHAQKAPAAKPKPAPPVPTPPAVPAIVPATPPAVLPAEKPAEGEKPDAQGRKLPRFQSLRSDEVNLRSGPGTRYRIDWVYKRRELPVEVEREFEHWRLIRDSDGIQGWVNQATLTARRNFIVTGADATLLGDAKESGSPVATLKPGVIGRIRSCAKDADWCQVQVGNHRGYLRRGQFWGTFPREEVTQ